jgi:hypothetical protein
MTIEELVKCKKLALYDFSSVSVVKPTGRYLDAEEDNLPEYYQNNMRYSVEVKTGWLSKKWVLARNLKTIKGKQ